MIEFTEEDRKVLEGLVRRHDEATWRVFTSKEHDLLLKLAERPAGDAEGLREGLTARLEESKAALEDALGEDDPDEIPGMFGIKSALAALADSTEGKA